MGVDSEGEVASVQVPHSPQCGVLSAEELAQVFVEHKHKLGHTCNDNSKIIIQTEAALFQSALCLFSEKRFKYLLSE